MIDQFFTPPEVAAELLAFSEMAAPGVVFDPAMGSGALLAAAEKQWDVEELIGLDIDYCRVEDVGRERPDWLVGRADFLSARSRGASRAFRQARGRIDVAVINPPFSSRGMAYHRVPTPLGLVSASKAMAFVVVAFQYLADGGELLALLPDGCIMGERDHAARSHLEAQGAIDVVASYRRGAFPGTAATTAAVRIRRSASGAPLRAVIDRVNRVPDLTARLVRGCVRLDRSCATTGDLEFVHTIHLQGGAVQRSSLRASHTRVLMGPAVLIPRVGAVAREKVSLFHGDYPIVLSDCVLALTVHSSRSAELLQDRLLSSFQAFSALYRGSGAPFVTMNRLVVGLGHLGVKVESSPPTS